MHPLIAIVKRDWHNQSYKLLFAFAALFFYLGLSAASSATNTNIIGWVSLLICVEVTTRNARNLANCYGHYLGFVLPDYGYYQFVVSVVYSLLMFTLVALLFAVSISHWLVLVAAFYVLATLLYLFPVAKTISVMWGALFVLITLMSGSLFFQGIIGLFEWLNGLEQSVQFFAGNLSSQLIYMLAYLLGCALFTIVCLTLCLSRHQLKQEYNPDAMPLSWRQNDPLNILSGSLARYSLFSRISRRLGRFIAGKTSLEKLCYLDRDERIFYVIFLLILLGILGFVNVMLPQDPNPEGVIIPLAIFFCFFVIAIYSANSVEFLKRKSKFAYLWLTHSANSRQTYMNCLVKLLATRLLRSILLFTIPIMLMMLCYSGYKLSLLVLLSGVILLLPSLLLQIAYSLFVTMTMEAGSWLRYQSVIFSVINIFVAVAMLWFVKPNLWWYACYPVSSIVVGMVILKYWQRYVLEM
ncbi:hypothetical protein [Neptunicella sp.]|uniref:hypothetical protein n=1 Tax=Neptunicella sp. TaxID=2125986 RepID=UPI003F690138